ncbi:YcnI family protein [Paenibacillus naphthalenovorans]|uniref:Nuclear export factor GLE1 n=1 Tax=Paenibacillus naphthalenovorans TaxID=162209 RepID=A0A0U2L3C7_9BACL|nr:YcnI family protein [Paenibacillus naphthalenovorans]ALS24338.1 nuclear export factor GLE1 [Paenibacillus naphthalenovorans]
MKPWRFAIIWFAVLLLAVQIAEAHVTVNPNETFQGAHEVFTVRVPNEKEASTVRVEVHFPEQISISRVQPLAGWSYEFTKNAEGDNTGIVWSAEGDGFRDGEFGEFRIQGRVADDAKEIVWKAYQTYSDGSVVEWTGDAGSDQPASVTKVAPGGGHNAGDHHAVSHQAQSNWVQSSAALISWLALVLAIVSIAVVSRRRASKL